MNKYFIRNTNGFADRQRTFVTIIDENFKVTEEKMFYGNDFTQVNLFVKGLTEVLKGNSIRMILHKNCEKIGTIEQYGCYDDIYTIGEIDGEACIDAAKKIVKYGV